MCVCVCQRCYLPGQSAELAEQRTLSGDDFNLLVARSCGVRDREACSRGRGWLAGRPNLFPSSKIFAFINERRRRLMFVVIVWLLH